MFNPFTTEEQAFSEGRYHTIGGEVVWYGASCVTGAWAELVRHSSIDAEFQKRYLSCVHVDGAWGLDFTDEVTRSEFGGYSRADLCSEDYGLCQSLAALVLSAEEIDGFLAPSAALPGHSILILRRDFIYGGAARLTEHDRKLGVPAALLADVRDHVPPRHLS